ncbi:unnamed protein product [Boreogadus saida]
MTESSEMMQGWRKSLLRCRDGGKVRELSYDGGTELCYDGGTELSYDGETEEGWRSSTGDGDPKPICPLQHESPARVFTATLRGVHGGGAVHVEGSGAGEHKMEERLERGSDFPRGSVPGAPRMSCVWTQSPRPLVPLNGEQSSGQPRLIII